MGSAMQMGRSDLGATQNNDVINDVFMAITSTGVMWNE